MKKTYLLLLLHFAITTSIFSTPLKACNTHLSTQVIRWFALNSKDINFLSPTRQMKKGIMPATVQNSEKENCQLNFSGLLVALLFFKMASFFEKIIIRF